MAGQLFLFLGGTGRDPGTLGQRVEQQLVRDDVELLLGLALDVHLAGPADHVLNARAAHLHRDGLARQCDRRDHGTDLGPALPCVQVLAEGSEVVSDEARPALNHARCPFRGIATAPLGPRGAT